MLQCRTITFSKETKAYASPVRHVLATVHPCPRASGQKRSNLDELGPGPSLLLRVARALVVHDRRVHVAAMLVVLNVHLERVLLCVTVRALEGDLELVTPVLLAPIVASLVVNVPGLLPVDLAVLGPEDVARLLVVLRVVVVVAGHPAAPAASRAAPHPVQGRRADRPVVVLGAPARRDEVVVLRREVVVRTPEIRNAARKVVHAITDRGLRLRAFHLVARVVRLRQGVGVHGDKVRAHPELRAQVLLPHAVVRRRLDATAAGHGALAPGGRAEEERVAGVAVLALQEQKLARGGQVLDLVAGDEEAPRRRVVVRLRRRLETHAVVVVRARGGGLGHGPVRRPAALGRADRLALELEVRRVHMVLVVRLPDHLIAIIL